MNLSINRSYNNPCFSAKNPKYTIEYMDKVLNPLLSDENVTVEQMAKITHYTNHRIHHWFLKSKGMSAAAFFKLKKMEKLKNELIDFYNKNIPESEIAKFYNYSVRWVNDKLLKFKIKESREELNERLAQKVPNLLKEGRSVEYIASEVNCSSYIVSNWINENIRQPVIEFRRKNNIKLKKDFTNEELELKQKLETVFAEGKGIKEAAKIIGITRYKVIYWKERFNLKTKKEEAVERMEKLVPLFVPLRMSLQSMAKEIGELSTATIRRFINSKYGKNYIDIRMGR